MIAPQLLETARPARASGQSAQGAARASGQRPRRAPELRLIEPTPVVRAGGVSRTRLAAIASVAVVVMSLFGAVVAHVVLAQDQFQFEQLQHESSTRQAEYDRLRLQVAELESPQRIVATAQELGMVVPPGVTYLAPASDAGATARAADDLKTSTTPSSSWVTVKSHLAAG